MRLRRIHKIPIGQTGAAMEKPIIIPFKKTSILIVIIFISFAYIL